MDMDKKTLILLIVCIVVFAFVALSYAGVFSHDDTVSVGDVTFKLPEGYKNIGANKKGYERATDGLDTIYFTSYDDKNLSGHVNKYIKDCKSKNKTVVLSNFTNNGVSVYKTVGNDSTHYWFIHDGKTYAFFTWKEILPMEDKIARSLINSVS